MAQKFKRGDRVHVSPNLGQSMGHFRADADAWIVGSYRDQFGGGADGERSYTVMFCDTGGKASWYYEHQLDACPGEHGEEAMRDALNKREAREAREGDLDWIVSNWATLREKCPGASAETLMRLVGIYDPWGPHGEGVTWHENAYKALSILAPLLEAGKSADEIRAWAHERSKLAERK